VVREGGIRHRLRWLALLACAGTSCAVSGAEMGGLLCPGASPQRRIVEVVPPKDKLIALRAGRGAWLIETEERGVDIGLVLRDGRAQDIATAESVPERAAWQFLVASGDRTREKFGIRLRPNPYSPNRGRVEVRLSCLDDQPLTRRHSLEELATVASELAESERDGIGLAKRTELREAALASLDAALPDLHESLLLGWAEHNAGFLLRRLGRMRDALPRLEHATAEWKKAGYDDRALWAEYQAAMTRIALAQYGAAGVSLVGVIASAHVIGDIHLEGNARNDACLVRRYQSDYTGALACYDTALRILFDAEEPASFLNAALNRAQVEKLLGRSAQSKSTIEQACLHLAARAAPSGDRMRCALARASQQLDRGRMDQAITGFDEALKLAEVRDDIFWRGTLLLNLADARRLNGENGAATALLDRAARLFGENDLPERSAAAWIALSRLDRDIGDRAARKAHLATARALYDTIGGGLDRSRVRIEQARDALADGDVDEARRVLADAEKLMPNDVAAPLAAELALAQAELMIAEARPAEAIRLIAPKLEALEASSLGLGFDARRLLARAHVEEGADAAALEVLDEGILRALRLAGHIGHPLLRRALAGEARKLVETYLAIALGDRPESAAPQKVLAALTRVDAVRAPVWEGFRQIASGLAQQSNARREYLLQWIDRTASNRVLAASPQLAMPGMAVPSDIDAAVLELDAIEAGSNALASTTKTVDNAAATFSSANIVKLLDALPNDTAIIAYFAGRQRSYRFVVRASSLRADSIPGDDALSQTIGAWRDALASSLGSSAASTNESAAIASMVWPDLPQAISRVQIMSDGMLERLPFAALPSGDDWLIRRMTIEYLATLRVATAESAHASLEHIAVLADPVSAPNLSPIPATRSEISSVAEAFPHAHISVFAGADMSAASLRGVFDGSYDIVHVASHAFADASRPEFGGILVSRTDDGKGAGVFTWRDLLARPLNAGIVTLGACGSGTGPLDRTEGALSLARAFAYGGAHHVVASRWDVDDFASATLMSAMYAALARNASVDEALALAQRSMLTSRRYSAPRYWAPYFELKGNSAETNGSVGSP